MNKQPDLSVVILAPRGYGHIRKVVQSLGQQSAANNLELVIVAPSNEQLALVSDDLEPFLNHQVLRISLMDTPGQGKAAGVLKANAPIVGFLEDHTFPASGWAEALIRTHRQDCAAVGPVIRNANPETKVSWSHFLLFFSQWLEPIPAGEVDSINWNSSSYKLNLLLEFGPELPRLLRTENNLQGELRKKGHRILIEPDAVIYHYNFSRLMPWFLELLNVGLVFANGRSLKWGILRRLGYCLGSPLIPLIRLARILPRARRAGLNARILWGIMPILLLGILVNTVGEALGYAINNGFKDHYFDLVRHQRH
jgi:hypothetical protein